MRRLIAGSALVLLLGCAGNAMPVESPAPRQLPANSTVRIWTESRNQLLYRASVQGDSLIGSSLAGRGEQVRVAIPIAEVDSLRVVRGSSAKVFVLGIAIGLIATWLLVVGGF